MDNNKLKQIIEPLKEFMEIKLGESKRTFEMALFNAAQCAFDDACKVSSVIYIIKRELEK